MYNSMISIMPSFKLTNQIAQLKVNKSLIVPLGTILTSHG